MLLFIFYPLLIFSLLSNSISISNLNPTHEYCPFNSNVRIDYFRNGYPIPSNTIYDCNYKNDHLFNTSNHFNGKTYNDNIINNNNENEHNIITNTINPSFSTCKKQFPNELIKIPIGILVGNSIYRENNKNIYDTLFMIESNLKLANVIYIEQFGIILDIIHIIISQDTSAKWENPNCKLNILTQYNNFRHTKMYSNAIIWHLFDNCNPQSSIVGIATTGIRNCQGNFKSMTNGYIKSLMMPTFVHEIGHNLGANHHNQNGIMDSNSMRLDGIYKFNPISKDSICKGINTIIDCNLFTYTTPSCGNHRIDTYEECEPAFGNICTNTCKLLSRCQCNPIQNTQCCNKENCLFYSSQKVCSINGINGYCANGYCEIPKICDGQLYQYVNTWPNNECKLICKINNNNIQTNFNIRNNVFCKSKQYLGSCFNGNCNIIQELIHRKKEYITFKRPLSCNRNNIPINSNTYLFNTNINCNSVKSIKLKNKNQLHLLTINNPINLQFTLNYFISRNSIPLHTDLILFLSKKDQLYIHSHSIKPLIIYNKNQFNHDCTKNIYTSTFKNSQITITSPINTINITLFPHKKSKIKLLFKL